MNDETRSENSALSVESSMYLNCKLNICFQQISDLFADLDDIHLNLIFKSVSNPEFAATLAVSEVFDVQHHDIRSDAVRFDMNNSGQPGPKCLMVVSLRSFLGNEFRSKCGNLIFK